MDAISIGAPGLGAKSTLSRSIMVNAAGLRLSRFLMSVAVLLILTACSGGSHTGSPSQVAVPNVVGMTQAAATSAITGAGLVLGIVTTTTSATVPSGSVIGETPAASTMVAPGSAVNLTVSSGPAQIAVPNVVGMTQADATSSLSGAELTLGTVDMVGSATVPSGSVISENPAAGTSVAPGSAVNLVVSSGVPQVVVPNVLGLTQAVATAAITTSGLQVGTVTTQSSTTVAMGLVINESPAAGTDVPSGSAVGLVVSSGSPAAGAPTAVIDAVASVIAYSTVLLDGTGSGDPTAAIQSYAWTQIAGPAVTLASANAPQASFVAPQVSAPTPLTFGLTIKDSTGATSTTSVTINVNPAATSQLAVTLVSARILEAVPTNPHSDFVRADGPPLAGSGATIAIDLTGAVQSPAFTLVDANGNVLSSPILTMSGTPSVQPLTFFGPINVPTVPFRVAASGKTADGQVYAVRSAALLVPMNMKVSFSPSVLWLAAGAAGNSQLTIYNGGQTATFTVQFTDPQGLLSSKQTISVPIGASTSATVPIPLTYPTTSGVIGPAVTATASVNGDPTRTGTATLTVWRNGAK